MEDNSFFRFVWRINGLVIMVGGLMAIVVLAFSGYKIAKDITRERGVRNIVNVKEEKNVQEKWQLGNLSKVQGSPYVMISLNSDQSYAQSYYSKALSSVRNYLFINSSSNEKHWLLETNQYLITNATFLLSEKEDCSKPKNVIAILYKIVKDDTNNDGRLTGDDLQTIGLSLPTGQGYKEVINGIDQFIGYSLVDEGSVLVVFQRNGVGFSAHISLSDFTVLNETELPKVEF